jgi:hypothetical protein
MESLGEKKIHLEELEGQKYMLEEEIQKANQRFKLSLLGIGVGVILLPFTILAGIPVLVVAGLVTIYYSAKKSSYEDKLATLESEIHKLEISMA